MTEENDYYNQEYISYWIENSKKLSIAGMLFVISMIIEDHILENYYNVDINEVN
jgi:hypothetical protein